MDEGTRVLKSKRCIIDMKCSNEESYKWCILRSLHPRKKDKNRIDQALRDREADYIWEEEPFSERKSTYEPLKFEINNPSIGINFFTFYQDKFNEDPERIKYTTLPEMAENRTRTVKEYNRSKETDTRPPQKKTKPIEKIIVNLFLWKDRFYLITSLESLFIARQKICGRCEFEGDNHDEKTCGRDWLDVVFK